MIGIDEVGRGAWAGPLVAAAVELDDSISDYVDSKILTAKEREAAFMNIRRQADSIGIGWVSSVRLDKIGLEAAVSEAMSYAFSSLSNQKKAIVVDGRINYVAKLAPKAKAVIKADATHPSVSAASIVAKVCRDSYMRHLDNVHSGYQFASHKGYGTPGHRAALQERGVCLQHRMSYRPVRSFHEYHQKRQAGRKVSG